MDSYKKLMKDSIVKQVQIFEKYVPKLYDALALEGRSDAYKQGVKDTIDAIMQLFRSSRENTEEMFDSETKDKE